MNDDKKCGRSPFQPSEIHFLMSPKIKIKTAKERNVSLLLLNFIAYLLMQNENIQKEFPLKTE